ncbi:M24 family metallopeptidase [Thioalkalivibrio sp. HK1]|uniref:M24 family metallopeptidase n=1 Tax=Thioalkalivibrio sp. HK1 TaxID=1469245 RepID=UPI00046F5235|nr:Xaa-Pro peptidase family protein [Thioalkalivibrio sp. HK1]
MNTVEEMILNDDWSDVQATHALPDIDIERMHRYRLQRILDLLKANDTAMCMLVNPISLRYAIDYRCYQLFQSHIPLTYLFIPLEGPLALHDGYARMPSVEKYPRARPISFFDGGDDLPKHADDLAGDIVDYLSEIGARSTRVALEYVNPSIVQALERRRIEVIDAAPIIERAHLIKSTDEINCIRHAVAVAEHGIAKMRKALEPGVNELQLWGLLNYTNIANNGDWHEGRMLASGPRINPWLQEATDRRIEAGDLVGFDTDMVGPFGYFADISRTFLCGNHAGKRQKQLYRLAVEEIEYNLALLRPGLSFKEFQRQAYIPDEAFWQQAYVCTLHGVGMCDEYPYIKPSFRKVPVGDGAFEAGMVVCVESYHGAVGERDGVKIEQQVLITEEGYEMLTTYPLEERLLD